MAIYPESGHTAIAVAVAAQAIHLAWGTGEPFWDSDQTAVTPFVADLITLPHQPVSAVAVLSQDGAVTYAAGLDYDVDDATGIVTRLAGGTIAADATVRIDYHAERQAEDPAATALLAEIGRRATLAQYVVEVAEGDPAAGIELPDPLDAAAKRYYALSETPTPHLFVRFNFDYTDAPAAVIREIGVFLGTQVKAEVPPGQTYFEPADLDAPGTLLSIEHIPPLARSASVRPSFEFVLTF